MSIFVLVRLACVAVAAFGSFCCGAALAAVPAPTSAAVLAALRNDSATGQRTLCTDFFDIPRKASLDDDDGYLAAHAHLAPPGWNRSGYHALAHAGLLRRSVQMEYNAVHEKAEDVVTYTLSPLGRRYGHVQSSSALNGERTDYVVFCYGREVPLRVMNFTIPGANNVIRAWYTYSIDALASWALDAGVRKSVPPIDNEIAGRGRIERSVLLILTNTGWAVNR